MQDTKKEQILLHACCAPCTPHVFNVLSEQFEVILFFFNPNIQPKDEYELRKAEIARYSELNRIKLITGDYEVEEWEKAVAGHEEDPEGGGRCEICYKFRLKKTAREAEKNNIGNLTTTLSISPHKNAGTINRIGNDIAAQKGINFFEADFKKKNGFRISCEISKEYGFFRQSYCGCLYSRRK